MQELAKRVDADIVISSAWRGFGVDRVRSWLGANQLTANIVGATPQLEEMWLLGDPYDTYDLLRALEIEWWLTTNVDRDQWPEQRIVILDDDDEYDFGHLAPWLVLINRGEDRRQGLMGKHIEQALEVLQRPLGELLSTPSPWWTAEGLKSLREREDTAARWRQLRSSKSSD